MFQHRGVTGNVERSRPAWRSGGRGSSAMIAAPSDAQAILWGFRSSRFVNW
jgi:hypothetical protein